MDSHITMHNMRDKCIRLVGAFLIGYVFVVHMVIDASGEWNGLFHVIYTACVFSEFLVIFLCIFTLRADRLSAKMVTAYLVWLVLSRPLCGDTKLTVNIELITIVAFCTSIMCYALSLDAVYRRRLVAVFSVIICVFYLVIAVSIIYVAVTRTVVRLPFDITVGIKSEGEMRYVTVFGRQRSIAAQWSCLSFCLTAYLIYICRSKIARIFLGISEVFFFVAVSLSLSRTAMASLAAAVAMLTALLAQKVLTNKKDTVRVLAALLAAIAVLPAAYKLQSAAGSAVEHLSQQYISFFDDEETSNAGTAMDAHTGKVTELAEEGVLYTETRNSDNTKMLGGRVKLWKCILSVLRFEPERFLHGGSVDDYMTLVCIFGKEVVINTHNFLLEPLLLTGIPGFFAVFTFTAILVVRMIKVFFSKEADGRAKLLTVLLGSLLIRNMGEAQIFRVDDITNYVFCLAVGAFLAYSYELFPEKAILRKVTEKENGI